jgi:hypothetical protein
VALGAQLDTQRGQRRAGRELVAHEQWTLHSTYSGWISVCMVAPV